MCQTGKLNCYETKNFKVRSRQLFNCTLRQLNRCPLTRSWYVSRENAWYPPYWEIARVNWPWLRWTSKRWGWTGRWAHCQARWPCCRKDHGKNSLLDNSFKMRRYLLYWLSCFQAVKYFLIRMANKEAVILFLGRTIERIFRFEI